MSSSEVLFASIAILIRLRPLQKNVVKATTSVLENIVRSIFVAMISSTSCINVTIYCRSDGRSNMVNPYLHSRLARDRYEQRKRPDHPRLPRASVSEP